jgi:hypothetical protein
MAGLMRAADAFRNVRAVLTLFATFLLVFLVLGLFGMTRSAGGIALGVLVAILVWIVGVSSAGIQYMNQVHGLDAKSADPGLLGAVLAGAKLIAMAVIFFICSLIFLIPIAIMLFICKIPGIGPFLLAIVIPVSTVMSAVFYFGLWVAFALSAPAVWEGNTIMGALARVYAIARNRGFEGMVMLILLSILCGLVALLVFAGFGSGYAMTMGLAGSILKQGIGGGGLMGAFGGLFSSLMSMSSGMRGGGNALGIAFGTLLLLGLMWPIIVAPWVMGLNLVYVGLSQGLDASAAEGQLAAGFAQAKQKAAEMQDLARQRAAEMQARAQEAAAQRAASINQSRSAPPPPACPGCGQAITEADVFCGNCGHKLK